MTLLRVLTLTPGRAWNFFLGLPEDPPLRPRPSNVPPFLQSQSLCHLTALGPAVPSVVTQASALDSWQGPECRPGESWVSEPQTSVLTS